MTPWFHELDLKLPQVHVSVGLAKGVPKAIGLCFGTMCDETGTSHVFICPTQGEPTRVLDILLHELIHAAVGTECGHKGEFKRVAKLFGLSGRMTATYVEEGTELHKKLVALADSLGPYPHSVLSPPRKEVVRVGWTRMKSTQNEDYKVLVSPAMLAEHGAPTCPWGEEMIPNKE